MPPVPPRLLLEAQEALRHFDSGTVVLRALVGLLAALVAAADGDRWVSAAEAQRITSISRRWFYEHAAELPFARRKAGRVVFHEAGLRRWMEER